MLFLGNPLTNVIIYGPEPIATQPIPVTGTGGPPATTHSTRVGWPDESVYLRRHDPNELEARIKAQRAAFSRRSYEEALAAAAKTRAAHERAKIQQTIDAKQKAVDDAKARIRKQIDDAVTKLKGH